MIKAIVLIIIGATNSGDIVSRQVGTYDSAKDCQQAGTAFFAAAAVKGLVVTGLCIATPFPFKGRES